MAAPLVSVIIPNFNHAAFLRERIRSVLGQTVADLEVILLDDASTDDSVLVMRAFTSDPRVTHVVVNEVNSGSPFHQWRKGMALARGTWVWIAESDDSCAPDLLERLLKYHATDEVGLRYSQSRIIDEDGIRKGSMLQHTVSFTPNPFAQDLVMPGAGFVHRFLKVKNVVPNASAVIFRRDLLDVPRIWEGTQNMRMCGDWLFWVRLASRTQVGFVAEELNHFREHAAVSRFHHTAERQKRRLLEERLVREELALVPGVDQRAEEATLYAAWAKLFAVSSWLSMEVDAIRLSGRSRLAFLLSFLRYKWTARQAYRRQRG